MKKLFILISTFLCFGSAVSQTSLLDNQLININQSAVTSGIIYDRVTPLADLMVFNMPAPIPHNTADFRFFKQALFELYKASNNTRLVSIAQLEQKISIYNTNMNVVPIGIINTPFQMLNFNPENANESGLLLNNGLFTAVAGKNSFLNGYALVVSPLKNVMQGDQIVYKFSNDLIFNNGNIPIKTLIADFGDGIQRKIIENGILAITEVVIVNNKSNGGKKLNFTVTLNTGFTFTTNASIYTIQGNASAKSGISQEVACSSEIKDQLGLIENFKTDYVEADEAFKGLNETAAIKGKIEARVFYHTNNSNTQKTLLKPIIIVDGFDPSDGRKIDDCDCERDPDCQEANEDKVTKVYDPVKHISFVELLKYKDENNDPQNIINVLRTKGYDVILVNQPTYKTAGVTVDGGADYIERNGKAFVQLVKEVNIKLQTNGSTEKLVVVGPSMGGQITRYALAYMEKKFAETGNPTWQHNTRIWVAFDSPNHGANVSLGDQALINILAEENDDAKKSFNKLQSTAANEMLINYFKMTPTVTQFGAITFDDLDNNYSNASTTTQGIPNNAGNPLFQEHYNNQFNNGLPNSNGFPMNLRKLAIVNGSLTGETFGNGYEKILDINLSKRICLINFSIGGWSLPSSCYTSKLFQAESYSMPTSKSLVARTEKLKPFQTNKVSIFNASANSIRGILDNVPGGYIAATGDLYTSITGVPAPDPRGLLGFPSASLSSFYYNHVGNLPQWETRAFKPRQCFIPTYSAIGIKNPNQSWSNPLDRNLICTNETYFDSFFGESSNTPHVELNFRSVNWLLKEIGTNTVAPLPQSPYFPIKPNQLYGENNVCQNQQKTYQFLDLCKIPGKATFTVVGNLTIVSATDYSVTVKGGGLDGSAKVIANFGNGITTEKEIWIGKPDAPILSAYSSTGYPYDQYDLPVRCQFNTEWHFESTSAVNKYTTNFKFNYNGLVIYKRAGSFPTSRAIIKASELGIQRGQSGILTVSMLNSCGETTSVSSPYTIYNPTLCESGVGVNCVLGRLSNPKTYKVYPNPSNDIVYVDLVDENLKPAKNAVITAELYDILGMPRGKVTIIDNKAVVDVKNLNRGIYVLKINIDGQEEGHQIAVQ